MLSLRVIKDYCKGSLLLVLLCLTSLSCSGSSDQDLRELENFMCDHSELDYIDEPSDIVTKIETMFPLIEGNNQIEVKDWVVALQGRKLICFEGLTAIELDDSNRLPLLDISGQKFQGETVNFENVGWRRIKFSKIKTVLCHEVAHPTALKKGSRFSHFTITSNMPVAAGHIYWVAEGLWKNHCKK